MSEKQITTTEGSLITQDNWKLFLEEYTIPAGFLGYMKATGDVITELDIILENSKDFESLQKGIKNLKQERATFKSWAEDHYP